jgi:hypothetical protein
LQARLELEPFVTALLRPNVESDLRFSTAGTDKEK